VRTNGSHDRPNENLHAIIPAQTQPATANLQQAWTTRLKHSQLASCTQPKLGHAIHPLWVAMHVLNHGKFTAGQQFQRHDVAVQDDSIT
jgi:hypothetical protein